MSVVKELLSWVKPSLSGEDGKLSIRRFLALLIGLVYSFSVVFLVINSDSAMYSFFTVAVSAVVFMLLLQIIYPNHLIDAIKAYQAKKEDENN